MKELKEFGSGLGREVLRGRKTAVHALQEFGALFIVWAYMGIGELHPETQRFFLTKMAPSIAKGERRRMSRDAPFLLRDFKIIDETKSKIPKDDRPKLIIGNHWDRGPLHGRWPSYLISKAIIDVLGDGLENEVRWVMQDALELTIPLPLVNIKTGRVMPTTEYILDKIIKSHNLFKVKAPFKVEGKMNNRETDNVVREIARAHSEGIPIGLYPEAQGTVALEEGNWRSGFLTVFLARKNPAGVVIPVGQWNEGRDLHLNFGDPFPISSFAKFRGREGYQEVVNLIMRKIAPLVPQNYRGPF